MDAMPNALETSTLYLERHDLTEFAKRNLNADNSGIDNAMGAPEFKIESAKSKERSDKLMKQSGLKGELRNEYIKDHKAFYNDITPNA